MLLQIGPYERETAAMAPDTDAAVKLLIDICLEQHRVRRIKTMSGLVDRLKIKLKQHIP